MVGCYFSSEMETSQILIEFTKEKIISFSGPKEGSWKEAVSKLVKRKGLNSSRLFL